MNILDAIHGRPQLFGPLITLGPLPCTPWIYGVGGEIMSDKIAGATGLHAEGGRLFAGDNPVLKGWESFSGWYWFGVEKVEERKVADGSGSVLADGSVVDDVIWFGYVQGLEEEWGDFSEAEIRSLGNRAWTIKKCDLPYAGRRD